MKNIWLDHKAAVSFTVIGLLAALLLGWQEQGTLSHALEVFFICSVLAVLEISLSFDNAIVNARILKNMSPIWQRRFLTFGIIIAVFLMRIVFPIAVVCFSAWIDPWSALKLAIFDGQRYGEILAESHISIAAFGGTFLLMVSLNYFLDPSKEVFWLKWIEKPISFLGNVKYISVVIAFLCILIFYSQIAISEQQKFLVCSIYGLLTFLVVEAIGDLLHSQESTMQNVQKAGAGAFLYLEILDASFSFDGVIGAFALSKNLFIIALGLGIGAFYVRSMTIALVKRETLARYCYLEHGAFYAIFLLAITMYLQTITHISEYITGLVGVVFILLAFLASVKENKRQA